MGIAKYKGAWQKMATRKAREEALLRIDVGNGTDAYARVLGNSQIAIYELRIPHGEKVSLSAIFDSEILFKVTVMKFALVPGRWPMVDQRELEPELKLPTEYFINDKLTRHFSAYWSSDGSSRDSTYEECKNLESAAVWNPEYVEDRLRDYFAARSNQWVEQLRATS